MSGTRPGQSGWLGVLLVVMLSGQIAVLVACLGRYPASGTDDIWSASTAHTLVTQGRFGHSVSAGAHGSEVRDYFPPGNILLVALSYLAFGFGVWQTKIVALACGLATMAVVGYFVARLTGSKAAGVAAALFLATSGPTFLAWENGRYDSPSIFFGTLAACLTLHPGSVPVPLRRALAAGVLVAAATVTYYPFGVVFGTVGVVALLTADRAAHTRHPWRLVGGFAFGGLVIGMPFLAHVLARPDLFRAQIIDSLGFYQSGGVWTNVVREPTRYGRFLTAQLGFGEAALAIVSVLCVAGGLGGTGSRIIWRSLLIWLAALTLYGVKDASRIAFFYPYVALAVGVAFAAFWRGLVSPAAGRAFVIAGAVTLVVIGVKMSLLLGTVSYQWTGRDYGRFSDVLTKAVPPDADVIAVSVAWYALVTRSRSVRTLSAGGPQTEYFEKPWLEDGAVLHRVSHIVLAPGALESRARSGRLKPLFDYMAGRFIRVASIRMPFQPLPWAPASPYDVDVYTRIPAAAHGGA